MNIGILASGGDAAGMNYCLYKIVKQLYKSNNISMFRYGYKGLIEDDKVPFDIKQLYENRYNGGIFIGTSRCKEYETQEGIDKAINTYIKNNLDVLIVMGGNGSFKGSIELVKAGKNVLFIPCSIDNDVNDSDYSIGFDSACEKCLDYIRTVNYTMMSFDRACIYEVMGRKCDKIANYVASVLHPDYLYTSEKNNFSDCAKSIIDGYNQGHTPFVILRENLINLDELKKYIQDNTNREIRSCVIGYYQRGGKPTIREEKLAEIIANMCVKCIKNKTFNRQILLKKVENKYVPYILEY